MGKAKSYLPDGARTVTPYLVIRGAGKAIEFYKKVFGAQEVGRMPGSDGQTLLHAELRIGDSWIYVSDEFPGMGNPAPQTLGGSPVGIHLYVENVDATCQKAAEAGATITMPPADMFWGDRFAKLTDPFGHVWSIATHIEDLTPEEMQKRGAAAMAEMAKGKS
jgi:PhnB protein